MTARRPSAVVPLPSPVRHLRRPICRFLVLIAALFAVPTATAAVPAFRSATMASTGAAASSLTINVPAGVQSGDVLLAVVAARVDVNGTITPPGGWTVARSDRDGGGSSLRQSVYYHVVGSIEPASYTWTLNQTVGISGAIVAYSGVDNLAPLDTTSGLYTGQTKSIYAPSVTTTQRDDLVVGFFGNTNNRGISPPRYMPERSDVHTTGGQSSAAEDADLGMASAGATGMRVASVSGGPPASSAIGQLVALRSATAPPPDPPPPGSPPVSTAPPVVTGLAQENQTLSTTNGLWDGNPSSFAYQWLRCNTSGGSCVPISNAAASSYRAATGDVGWTLRSAVTATNDYGSTMATSLPTATVSAAPVPPTNTVLPAISGLAQVGQVLTASTGTWVGTTPMTFTFLWSRCNTSGGACAPIPGATAQTYTLTSADAGMTIRVTVTATNIVGSASATSVQTSVVSAGGGGVGLELPPPLPQSTGNVYYVATNGSSSNPGTEQAPWNLPTALSRLQAGQTALVHAGTYTGNFLMNRSGTWTNPITVKNYPGETPTIQAGTGSNCNDALQLYNSNYVRIQGFMIRGATGCDNNTNVYVAGNSSHVEISNNEIAYGHDHGLFADPGTLDVQVLRNRLHDNGTVGSGNKDHEVYMEGTRQLIADNVIYNTPYGHAVQIYPDNDGTIIVDNTITNTHYTSGYRAAAIIVGSDVAGSSANNMRIVNNITAYNDYGIYGYECGAASGSGNLGWNNDSYGNTYGNLVNDCSQDPVIDFSGGNRSVDPMFVDRPNNNFHLQAGSGAVNVGLAPWSAVVDHDGVQRPQGVAADLGAYER